MTTPQNSYGYADPTYLNMTADILRFAKQMSYERMRMQTSHHVLDLGCGPATDTIALAAVVGETGKVVGIDYDTDMIAKAQQKAESAGVSNYVSHEVNDAAQLLYADNTFDSCRSERVFQHLLDPEKALAELIRVTKPGGWIVILDTDWGSANYYSRLADIEAKVRTAYAEKGALHPTLARQVHHMMRQRGLESVSALPIAVGFTSYALASDALSMERYLKPRGLAGGYFTPDEFDRFTADLKQLDAQGNFFVYGCMILTAGQKPI